jgi:aspartyl-tRNA(Asn)/glutamyl-tRNA(Gln) amidotransferase subunit A
MSYKIPVSEYLEKAAAGEIDYTDFFAGVIEEARKLDAKYNFFVTIADLSRHTEAKESLYGLPISVKDCICVKGMQSSAGSRILEGYRPLFDATVIRRLKEKGCRVLGKTNQDEFGFGTFSTNSGYGIPKNPNDAERSCGGSSGGAAGFTKAFDYPHIALGQSTGGSISCPAAFCSVVGLTPTYGLVSRYGLIDYANSLDKIGPIGKSVHDVALMLSIIAGRDRRDSTSTGEKKDYTRFLDGDLSGMKIAVPKEYLENIEKPVEDAVWFAIKKMESLGAKYREISLPSTKYAVASYYIIATAEASTNLAKYCGMRYGLHKELEGNFNEYFSRVRSAGLGEEAKRRIMLGTFARMAGYRDAYYLRAMKVRTMIINDFKKAFKNFDIIAAPTMPIVAPRFSDIQKMTPLQSYQMDILTIPGNLAGIPMINIPADEMIGLHLMSDHFQEDKILQAGAQMEKIL